MDAKQRKKHFLLLQVNDALFPIGAYSHSWGLETYIQKNLVTTVDQTWEYVYRRLMYGFCYNEFLSVKLAYRYAEEGDLDKILNLEEELEAMRTPREVREAGRKLGSRFIKTVSRMNIPWESDIFKEFCEDHGTGSGRSAIHAVVYGVFCAAAGIPYEDAMVNYLYAQTSSMVTNCVKTIPLSQTDGQILLYRSQEIYLEILEKLDTLTEEELCLSVPGFDIRCMQHEGLYSRIYMS